MAFFSLDPEQMKKFIASVSEYSSFIESERSNIFNKNDRNNNPVDEVRAATRSDWQASPPLSSPSQQKPVSPFQASLGVGSDTSTIAGCSSTLASYASELQNRYDEVIYLNSNGVSSYNADGTLSYYLPDPPEGQDPAVYWATMDTSANVKEYNSQSVEAAKKRPRSSRQP